MGAKLIGALICWVLKGCRTNLFKDEWIAEKENRNIIVALLVALIFLAALFSSFVTTGVLHPLY